MIAILMAVVALVTNSDISDVGDVKGKTGGRVDTVRLNLHMLSMIMDA